MGTDHDWAAIADLVERTRRGDDDAFRELLERHRAVVTSTLVACGVRCPDTAGDLTQEIALKAWSRMSSLSDPRAFRAWLRRITANTARDHLRRSAARRETELEMALDIASADDPERTRERIAELRLMLTALAREDEEIVELLTARAAGAPVAELASRAGISEGALKMRMSRARTRLRRTLRDLRSG
jgi:RNA polymerase sigma-70 factor (ECF subfamily)